jgi:hypothetical protein
MFAIYFLNNNMYVLGVQINFLLFSANLEKKTILN